MVLAMENLIQNPAERTYLFTIIITIVTLRRTSGIPNFCQVTKGFFIRLVSPHALHTHTKEPKWGSH